MLRRIRLALAWLLLLAGLLVALTVGSIVGVAWIPRLTNYNWVVLGNVGQAFGFIAAIVSALALIALAWSVNLQVRESRAQRLEAHRQTHMQLVGMALNDSSLHLAWPFREATISSERRHAYLNLLFSWWQYIYSSGLSSDEDTRDVIKDILRGQPARDYVLTSRPFRSRSPSPREQLFLKIVDDVYADAVQQPAEPVSLALIQADSVRATIGRSRIATGGAILAAGFLMGRQLRHRSAGSND
jgi:Family of unknown function (DUF6082)